MHILGLSCFYHDAAACLIHDGKLVAAAQEERFSRVKHDWRFPEKAIQYCLSEAGISVDDVSLVAFYEKPILKFERVLETFLAVAPRGILAFMETIPSWLNQKLRVPDIIRKNLGYRGPLIFVEHHMAHAASSFFFSPFDEAAVLVLDGVGEWATASYGTGNGNRLSLSHEVTFPHSLGLLYSAFTAYLGFEVNDAEYKVMGMASYGSPVFRETITQNLAHINPDGSLTLNMKYFSFQHGKKMFNGHFERLFGSPGRTPESELLQKHFDIAASIQAVTEDVVLSMARYVHQQTGMRCLCLAGGVALNSVSNGKLLREGPFDELFIQPAAGDAGAALGAAYAGHHLYLKKEERHRLGNVYLGPFYQDADPSSLAGPGVLTRILDDPLLVEEVARLLSEGKVIGWHQGRMEFGPRALGNRSILADPRKSGMKDTVNRMVKFREAFRPFAPVVTVEDAERFFSIRGESPFMLLTFPVKTDKLPAVTHVDGSARVQTVSKEQNEKLYALLRAFERLTGVPVLLNTSLNLRGEPIACSPEDAYHCFVRSGMDGLVVGQALFMKEAASP